jgi:hypothetical protein
MKHIVSYPIFESAEIQQELLDLIERWVLGNEESLIFWPEDGERLVQLVDRAPWIREESRAHLRASGVTQLWRGLHEEWDEEFDDVDSQGGSHFSSYSSSREVAYEFGGGDLVAIPVDEALDNMVISIEWAAGWLGIKPFSQQEREEFEAELDAGGIDEFREDSEDRWFRYMAWEQKEYLIRDRNVRQKEVTSRPSRW